MRGLPTIEPVPYDCHQLVSGKGILQALANQRSRLPVAPEWCLVQSRVVLQAHKPARKALPPSKLRLMWWTLSACG